MVSGKYTRKGRQGRPLQSIPWPSLDVRAGGQNGRSAAAELCKYVVKDVATYEHGEPVYDPDALARVYCALDGRRAQSATRGLWLWADEAMGTDGARGCDCPACGEVGALAVFVTSLLARPPPRPWARGPALPRPPVYPGEEGYHPGTDPAQIERWLVERRPVHVRPADVPGAPLIRPAG